MPRRYPCRETDTETDSERQIGPLESRILGKLVSPVRKGADGKGTLPVFRHCGCKRTHELRHKPFPRQPPTLPQRGLAYATSPETLTATISQGFTLVGIFRCRNGVSHERRIACAFGERRRRGRE